MGSRGRRGSGGGSVWRWAGLRASTEINGAPPLPRLGCTLCHVKTPHTHTQRHHTALEPFHCPFNSNFSTSELAPLLPPCRKSRFVCVLHPRSRVCVTYPGVRSDPSPAGEYDELSNPTPHPPPQHPPATTLGTLHSHTDGVINGRRASEGNSSLISTFAPDCRLC